MGQEAMNIQALIFYTRTHTHTYAYVCSVASLPDRAPITLCQLLALQASTPGTQGPWAFLPPPWLQGYNTDSGDEGGKCHRKP